MYVVVHGAVYQLCGVGSWWSDHCQGSGVDSVVERRRRMVDRPQRTRQLWSRASQVSRQGLLQLLHICLFLWC